MPDGADNGHAGGVDGAGNTLGVEAKEVFERSTTPRDDEQVDREVIDGRDGGGNPIGGRFALHECRREQDLAKRIAAAEDIADVAEYRALTRGDDADEAWVPGERALVFGG